MKEIEFNYKIILSFNLGKAVAKIEDFADGVTETMNEFGFEGKFIIRSQISILMTANIKLNSRGKILLKKELEKGMNQFQMWDWKVERFELVDQT